jgi:hypothetical protein
VSFRASQQGEALHRIKPAFGGASREIYSKTDFSASRRFGRYDDRAFLQSNIIGKTGLIIMHQLDTGNRTLDIYIL